jgi:protoporphyrinogen oxidase
VKKKVCVVGGGISGLSTEYFLLKKGYKVELFEQSDHLGGFASSFDFGGFVVEKYYHFICGGDKNLLNLAYELGIGDRVRFEPTKTASFYNGTLYSFSTLLDLLKFSPISFFSRLRFGLTTSYVKVQKKNRDHLEGSTAKAWLIKSIGENAYKVIWHPLLKKKFGEYYDQISASYIWHRIHRVATSRNNLFSKEKMGYFEDGSQTLFKTLRQKIVKMGGTIHLEQKAERVENSKNGLRVFLNSGKNCTFDRVVLAVPLPIAAQIIKGMNSILFENLSSIKFLGVICGVFRLRFSVSDAFWLNINDPRIATNGLIEYTNMNPLRKIIPDKIIYIPLYLPEEDKRFSESESAIQREFVKMLKVLRPGYSSNDLVNARVFRSQNAQSICTTGFKEHIPQVKTPIDHLFILDSTQAYPSDRSLDVMIRLSKNMVDMYF